MVPPRPAIAMRMQSIHTGVKLGKFPEQKAPMSAFTHVARHYETLMKDVPYGMWLSYLRLIWAKAGVSPRDVLEIACGTGRICRMLTSEGLNMTGIDVSPQMIEEANAMAQAAGMKIRFETQNASLLQLDSEFDAAFSFFDSLNNITDPIEFQNALTRIKKHLKPGGVFVFDLNTAYAFEKKMFDQFENKPDAPIRYEWKSEWNEATRICKIDMQFWTNEDSFSETHFQRAYTQNELNRMMDEAEYKSIKIYDAYTLNPPHKKSDRIHVVGLA